MVSQREKNKNLEFDILLLLSSLGIGLKFIKIMQFLNISFAPEQNILAQS